MPRLESPLPKISLWSKVEEFLTKIQKSRAVWLANHDRVTIYEHRKIAVVGPRRDTSSEHLIRWNEDEKGNIAWIECSDKATGTPCHSKLEYCTHIAALAFAWRPEAPPALIEKQTDGYRPRIRHNGTLLPFVKEAEML